MAVGSSAAPSPVRGKRRLWDRLYPTLSIAIPFLVIALFTIYPVLYAVRISFYQYILTKPKVHPFIGLRNYQKSSATTISRTP